MSNIPLVLLNGTACDAELWKWVTDKLAYKDVIIESPVEGNSVDDCARLLLEKLPERFCVAGFSLGAIIALHMIKRSSERLAGVVLIAVNPLPLSPETIAVRSETLKEAQEMTLRNLIENKLWQNYVAPHQKNNLQLKAEVIGMAERMGMKTFLLQSTLSLFREDCRVAFSDFQRPTLLISGQQDKLCLSSWHQDLALSNRHSKWENIEHSGHFIPLEAPDACADFLQGFLAKLK
ncbi:TPA_asm: alpha/beta hydrolase [Salmonella enterica subsp. houtenae serovar 45:g,z51:-]|uniref:Alpha/beta hydrolase n=1 Tax=Salmonella enterica subsp. houtenae serovar 45:g,z51:- TaxID=1967611 RepID=A0A736RE09_SALHO|nr:alpha/beta hydrolase [Salmonella enterica subsp. houtenae str. CFSAN000557]HAE7767732.1 alpha/beta hydrolase [Salmonella enterica subsp. houtenae serovar 45:g,z51:-]